MAYLKYIGLIAEASAPLPPSRYWEHTDSPWAPLRKSVETSKVAILGSSGVHRKCDPPFGNANDTSFRLIRRDTPVSDLALSHPAPINSPGKKDINVVFPLERFLELEAGGTIGRLADENPSIIGTMRRYDVVRDELGPAIARHLQKQEADLLCLFPL